LPILEAIWSWLIWWMAVKFDLIHWYAQSWNEFDYNISLTFLSAIAWSFLMFGFGAQLFFFWRPFFLLAVKLFCSTSQMFVIVHKLWSVAGFWLVLGIPLQEGNFSGFYSNVLNSRGKFFDTMMILMVWRVLYDDLWSLKIVPLFYQFLSPSLDGTIKPVLLLNLYII
jgi:hypothetical protein